MSCAVDTLLTGAVSVAPIYSDKTAGQPLGVTRAQSNLAKAASNVLHTLHALDSMTIAIPKICRGSQKSKVGHVTLPHVTYCCPHPYVCTLNFNSVASAVPEIRGGSQNLNVGSRLCGEVQDARLTQCSVGPRSVQPTQDRDLFSHFHTVKPR